MRTRLLLLSLVLLGSPAVAQSPADGAPAESARAAAAAPATVLEDRLDVLVDGSRARETRTWKVRIDDPARCTAGLVAPDGLDGASDDGAKVFERLLVLPDGTAAGTVYTLTRTRTISGSAHSGVFTTAPDLPVEMAEVTIRSLAPHLSVWSDVESSLEHGRSNGRTARITWKGLPGTSVGEAVWSTWRDWMTAGQKVDASIQPMLATRREQLGSELGRDLQGSSIPVIAKRAFAYVKYEPGGDERWSAARPTGQVIDRREGSAVDRGVLLISMLRIAGYDARPATYRPGAAAGAMPLAVPAPAMLTHPAVAVVTPTRVVLIDPATDRVAIPELPASMIGGSVWLPGDVPYTVAPSGSSDGTVAVSAQLTLGSDGAATWTATINASGAGQESLRNLLGPLDPVSREQVLRRLIAARGVQSDRLAVDAAGIDDPHRPLQITIQGHDPDTLTRFGDLGRTGKVAPLLAPALAGWLPPRILVREDLSIVPPSGLQPVSLTAAPPTLHQDVVLSRSVRREGTKLVLSTEVERPYRSTSAARDSAAERFLTGAAALGPEMLLLPPPTPDVVKSLRAGAEGRTTAELAVLEALLWWTYNDQPKKALKALDRALSSAPDEVAAHIARHTRADDPRPWLALYDEARTDAHRLAAVRGLEQQRRREDAWRRAARLATIATDPQVKVDALLAAERLQGARPDAVADPEGAALWREPSAWLDEAAQVAASAPGASADGDPRVVVRLARKALDEGRAADAEVMLERVLGAGPNPVAAILLAEASAASGLSIADVVRRIEEAVAVAPFDAEVTATAAHAVAQVGDRQLAFRYSLSAARLAFSDPQRWLDVVEPALAAGELGAALQAARRASDLKPASKAAADELVLVATLARNQELAMTAASRGATPLVPNWPPDLETLMGLAPEHALLALLQHHDAEVIASPAMLSLRAQLRMEAGLLDGASRDGALLAQKHGEAKGHAIAFAASAGRMWSNAVQDGLDEAAKTDLFAAAVRMEYRLIAWGSEAAADANRQKDDPRAQLILRAIGSPEVLAKEVPGWPDDLSNPTDRAPHGFRSNRVLGAVKGVAAWSDPERGMAVVRTSRPTGTLPPPIANLYTPAAPPVSRIDGGGQVLRLEGGVLPLYAAVRIHDGQEVTGLGFTAHAAVEALLLAVE